MSGRRHNTAFIKGSAAFSLVELLIVMVMSSLIVLAVASMFRSNRMAYSISDQVKSMEENVRIGMDMMGFSLRQSTVNSSPPLWIMDNDSANNSVSVNKVITDFKAAVTAGSGGAVKAGTDMIEVITSLCPDPMYVDFNQQSASMPRMPTPAVSACLDCDMSSLSPKEIKAECLSGIEATIQSMSGTGFTCVSEPTSTSAGGGPTITITSNRGSGTSNSPGDCKDPDWGGPGNSWPAKIDFGYHYIFYVYDDPLEPDNPKLMRYLVNGPLPGEVIANYIYDLQIMGGRDTTDDEITDIDTWEDGGGINATTLMSDSDNVRVLKTSILARTKNEDTQTKTQSAVTMLENSSITDPADNRRERVLTRSIRIRNKTF